MNANAINRFTREHRFLRSKLRLLKSALEMGEKAWFTTREVSFTLCKELKAHSRREAEVFLTCRSALGADKWRRLMAADRADGLGRLIMKQFFLKPPQVFEALRPRFTRIMAGLCCRMDRQEATLFPVLRCALGLDHPMESTAQPVRSTFIETMSVREAIGRHPSAQGTLEGLFINRRSEGHDRLDEVAWRHGMESQDLLTRLEEAAARKAAPLGDHREPTGAAAQRGEPPANG